jgi:hypothetical protein
MLINPKSTQTTILPTGDILMTNSNVQTDKYQLVEPIVSSLFGGTKKLKSRVILSGQIDNVIILKSFGTFLEVISYMCVTKKLFGARLEPELFHLRAVANKRLINSEYIDFKDIKIEPCSKNKTYSSKQLEFELDEVAFNNYLQCIPISNPLFVKKEDGWLKSIVNNFLLDDEELEFETPSFTPTSNQTLQGMVDEAIKYIFEPSPTYELASNGPSIYDHNFQPAFNIATTGQSNSNLALQNSNSLNSYIQYSPVLEPEKPKIVPDLKPVIETKEINTEENEIIHIPRKQSRFPLKTFVACGIGVALGTIIYGLVPVNNAPNIAKQNQIVPIATKQSTTPSTTPGYDSAKKIKTYDDVIATYTSQDNDVCDKLKSTPKAIKYGDNKWFSIDTSKYYLCQIGQVEKDSQSLTGDKLDAYKQSNSARIMNAITQSKHWLSMSK